MRSALAIGRLLPNILFDVLSKVVLSDQNPGSKVEAAGSHGGRDFLKQGSGEVFEKGRMVIVRVVVSHPLHTTVRDMHINHESPSWRSCRSNIVCLSDSILNWVGTNGPHSCL